MQFEWETTPDVFVEGTIRYRRRMMDAIYALALTEAELIQQFMRENAPWEDDCMPGKEYLKAEAFRDDNRFLVGIDAWYDEELYIQNCRQQKQLFAFGFAHELYTFKNAGIISIINTRRTPNVLADRARIFFDKVRALFA